MEKQGPRLTPQKSAPLRLGPVENPSPRKETTLRSVPGFDEVVNMASFFHDKYSHSSSRLSVLSDHSSTSGGSKNFAEMLRDKDFVVSPFRPSANDKAITDNVNMAISRLEDDSMVVHKSQRERQPDASVRASKDSGFNDLQSDSGGSSEGTFTDVMNKRAGVGSEKGRTFPRNVNDVNNAGRAQTQLNEEEEVHICFESNSDEEIDVLTEDSKGDDKADENNNLATKNTERSLEKTVDNGTESNTGPSGMHEPTKDGVLDEEDIFNDTHNAVVDEVIPETPQGIAFCIKLVYP